MPPQCPSPEPCGGGGENATSLDLSQRPRVGAARGALSWLDSRIRGPVLDSGARPPPRAVRMSEKRGISMGGGNITALGRWGEGSGSRGKDRFTRCATPSSPTEPWWRNTCWRRAASSPRRRTRGEGGREGWPTRGAHLTPVLSMGPLTASLCAQELPRLLLPAARSQRGRAP